MMHKVKSNNGLPNIDRILATRKLSLWEYSPCTGTTESPYNCSDNCSLFQLLVE